MFGFRSVILLLALIAAPLGTYAQRGGHGGVATAAGNAAYGYHPPAGQGAPPAPSSSSSSSTTPAPGEPNPTPVEKNPSPGTTTAIPKPVQHDYSPDSNPPLVQENESPNAPVGTPVALNPAPNAARPSRGGQGPSSTAQPAPTSGEPNPNPGQPAPAPAPAPAPGGGACTGSGLEIEWSGEAVSYSWPGGSGTTTGCTSLGSSFNGQVAVGGSGGTIIEVNPSGYFDVSFILGWTVPMVCSSGGAKTGCSLDLSSMHSCPEQQGSVCKNPTGPGGSHDPGSYNGCAGCTPWCYACSAPDPFFQPCAGSAYTYPYDDGATVGPASGAIQCCIGTGCGSTGREGSTKNGHSEPTRNPPCSICAGGSKRSVDELEEVFKRSEDDVPGMSPSRLRRRHKRSSHRHAIAHDLKALL